MSIQHIEVASQLTESEFNQIRDSVADFDREFIVHRQFPSFVPHSLDGVDSMPFGAAANDSFVVKAINDNGLLKVNYLSVEDDDPNTLGAWSTLSTFASDLMPDIAPSVTYYGTTFRICVVLDIGVVHMWQSDDPSSGWFDSDFPCDPLPVDGTLKHIAFGSAVETIYAVRQSAPSGSHVLECYRDGEALQTGIYWHDSLLSLDCETFFDSSDDAGAIIANSNVRHCIVMSGPLPNTFTYDSVISGDPTKKTEYGGGVFSFVLRPAFNNISHVPSTKIHHIHAYDNQTELQFRHMAKVSTDSSIFSSNKNDTLIVACLGGDGDANGGDQALGYQAIYYYTSRDGINWSQDRIVPFPSGLGSENFLTGIELVRCHNYLYLVGADRTLRSLSCREFGKVHPDWTLDISSRVIDHQISMSDSRSTSLSVDNTDLVLSNGLLGSGATLTLVTSIGKNLSAGRKLLQTSIETIDEVQPSNENPAAIMRIVARDRMSWLNDYSTSADAIQYDNTLIDVDNFDDVGGVANSGLSHTAAVVGSFRAADSTLRAINKYKESIAFNTFKSNIPNGTIQAKFWLPDPVTYGGTGPVDAPTYAGVIFRAQDKGNFWSVQFDWWSETIFLSIRVNDVNHILQTWAPTGDFVSHVKSGEYGTLRVQFRHNLIRIWHTRSDGKLYFLTEHPLPVEGEYPAMMQGYVGVIGCGYSDEDTPEFSADRYSAKIAPTILPSLVRRKLTPVNGKLFGINKDGYIYVTKQWKNTLPTWVRYDLGLSGTILGGVVDAYSPAYLEGSGPVNAWVITTTGLYYITDIARAPSAELLLTFAASSSYRSIEASFGFTGRVLVSSIYPTGEYVTASTDGETFPAESLVSSLVPDADNMAEPGAFVSHKTQDMAMTSAMNGGEGKGYKTLNMSSFTVMSSPNINCGDTLARHIHAPYSNNKKEDIVYHGYRKSAVVVPYDISAATSPTRWPVLEGSPLYTNSQAGGLVTDGVSISEYATRATLEFRLDDSYTLFHVVPPIEFSVGFYIPDWPDWVPFDGVSLNYNVWAYNASDVVIGNNMGGDTYEESWFPDGYLYFNTEFYTVTPSGDPFNISGVRRIVFQVLAASPNHIPVAVIGVCTVRVQTADAVQRLIRVAGTKRYDVSPAKNFTPFKFRQIDTCPTNRNLLAVAAGDLSVPQKVGIWVSGNGGAKWRTLRQPTAAATQRYERVAVDSDKNIYVFGRDGAIGVSKGTTITSKRGNLGSFSPDEFIQIGAWV